MQDGRGPEDRAPGSSILHRLMFRRNANTVLKQLLQSPPPLVLFRFGRLAVFLALEPKSKPVNVTLLRSHSLQRSLQDVLALREIYKVNGLSLSPQGGVNFPFAQYTARGDCLDSERGSQLIEVEARGTLDPCLQSGSKRLLTIEALGFLA